MAISAEKLQQLWHEFTGHSITENPREKKKPNFNNGFWGIKAPERIELASASLRKALMARWLLQLIDEDEFQDGIFPVAVAKKLPVWFADHVENGDNTLDEDAEIFLGYYNGVPVYAVSTTGETGHNTSPEHQAGRKLAKRFEKLMSGQLLNSLKEDQFYIVLAGDTVEVVHVKMPKSAKISVQGKPYNLPDFPKGSNKSLKKFWRRFYAERMPSGSEVTHITGVAGMMIGHGPSVEKRGKITFNYTVPSQKRVAKLVHDPDPFSGGGGATQRLIARGSEQYKDWNELHRFKFICQVMGMPLHYFLSMAQELSETGVSRITL